MNQQQNPQQLNHQHQSPPHLSPQLQNQVLLQHQQHRQVKNDYIFLSTVYRAIQTCSNHFSCPLIVKCPPDAEYIECGPACIPSCKEPSTNCTGSCISGCFCKPGFVFRGKSCVPIEKCGCLDEDNNYYEVNTIHSCLWQIYIQPWSSTIHSVRVILFQPGEIVFGNGCSKLCRCAGNYTLDCVDNTCDPTEECRQVGGIHGCYPKGAV